MTRIVLDIDDSRWKVDHLARVMRTAESEWLNELACQVEIQITDARPLIVLDLTTGDVSQVSLLRRALNRWIEWSSLTVEKRTIADLLDQIEAQTKPARIPETGLWGVVEAYTEDTFSCTWVHDQYGWVSHSGITVEWRNLIDPTLIRDGIES